MSPKMIYKSNEILLVIKKSDSFEGLCLMLADTYNLLELFRHQNDGGHGKCFYMIPAAQERIENFKNSKSFFSMTLKEAAPY